MSLIARRLFTWPALPAAESEAHRIGFSTDAVGGQIRALRGPLPTTGLPLRALQQPVSDECGSGSNSVAIPVRHGSGRNYSIISVLKHESAAMNLPQIAMAEAVGRAHMPMVRAALAIAPDDAVGFVCADSLGALMMATYAPSSKRFGSRVIDGASVFALRFADAQTLLRAEQHAGDRDTFTRIARQLSAGRCVCFAGGAIVLMECTPEAQRARSN